ncbi:MAG: hydrogenase iron-sulfur subunit [bacterium]|nr:hydrogenase iron-sulfur subunit [bacterium]
MRLLAFVCERSAARAVEEARKTGSWPDGLELVTVPCSGRVDVLHITGALTRGYAGVLVVGCFEEACEFVQGNLVARRRVDYLRQLLAQAGVQADRVRFEFASPAGAPRLVRAVREMTEAVQALGKGERA